MNRLAALAVGTALLVSVPNLLAQHGGHGNGSHGAPRPGSTDTSEASLTDFNHALAVQATPDQSSHFQELSKNTETARKLALELSKLKTDSATEFSRKSAALKDAVEEAQGGTEDFMKSFSKSQKTGLKDLTKKLEKADSEVGKQWKELEKQLGAKPNPEAISATADMLQKALADFQSQQSNLGTEMGIQTSSTPSGG